MQSHPLGHAALRAFRSVLGIALMLSGSGVLVEGGLSRYAKYGIPPHADWGIMAFGLILVSAGIFLPRPGYFLHRNTK
jgi:hypothetical protein